MTSTFVNIRNVLSKIRRDISRDFEEADAIEWIGEALDFVGAVSEYQERTAFIEVKDFQCLMPVGTKAIVQIARNLYFSEEDKTTACCEAVLAAEEDVTENYDFVPLDCNGVPISPYEVAYYRPFWDLERDYGFISNSNWYNEWYEPVRLANSTFFSSLVCKIPNSEYLYSPSQSEYTIADPYLRFSFKEGFVAVSYLTQRLDEDGYPMIPDNISYRTAATKYVAMKLAYRDFMSDKPGAATRLAKLEQDWHWYCKQAGNSSMMPNGIDEHQNLQDQRNYLLPRMYRYYGYFGRSATPENRTWNNRRYAI